MKAPEYAVSSGWLVEVVDQHTCGAGGAFGHEPGCGSIPVARVDVLLRAYGAYSRIVHGSLHRIAEVVSLVSSGDLPRHEAAVQRRAILDILAPDLCGQIRQGYRDQTEHAEHYVAICTRPQDHVGPHQGVESFGGRAYQFDDDLTPKGDSW